MSFVQAKCPMCGGMLAVDDSKKAANCQFCGEAFIVQEAVNNYITYNTTNNTYNNDNRTTYNYGEGAVVNVYENKQSVSTMLKRGFMLLKEDFSKADECFDKVLDVDPECAEAYLGKLMAELWVTSKEGLRLCKSPFDTKSNYLNIIHSNNSELKEYIINVNNEIYRKISATKKSEEVWENGVLYIDNRLVKAKPDISGSYTIKDGTTIIEKEAFMACKSLKSIIIPDSVTSIADMAFYGCDNLTSVEIGNGVTEIGAFAFTDCTSLKSVTIPGSVKKIGWYAFQGCRWLSSVTIGMGVTSIGEDAFKSCNHLEIIVIPDTVKRIEKNTFSNCTSLKTVRIGKGVEYISDDAFAYCGDFNIIIPAALLPKFKMVFPNSARVSTVEECEENARAYAESVRQRNEWKRKGLCEYCGGRLTFWDRRCKKCGHINTYRS